MSLGQVTIWYMTEEERQEYIKKHPIKPTKKTSEKPFDIAKDYKWRGEKAAASRWT